MIREGDGDIRRTLRKGHSVRILGYEHMHQAFNAGIAMNLLGQYKIYVGRESGNGYHDLMFKSNNWNRMSVVIEFKWPKIQNNGAVAKKGIGNAKKKNYVSGLEGKAVLYGMIYIFDMHFIVSEIVNL